MEPPSHIRLKDIARFRLRRHHLLEEPPADAVTLCRDVCGVQAQVMSAAYLQLWARNHAISKTEISHALWQTRTLVKTSLMRQTLHLIPADEFAIYISALRACRRAGALRAMERCGISAEQAEDITQATLKVLANGPCGRAEIVAALRLRANKAVRFWLENSWGVVRVPVADGLVCYGSGENNEVNFIRVDQWLPKLKVKMMPSTEAQAALLRNYLRAYGPASLRDFSHWAGIPMVEVRMIGPHVDSGIVEISEGKLPLLMMREDVLELEKAGELSGSVRLLPNFDTYLLAHHDKDHLLSKQNYKRVYRNQGWISAVVLVDGEIAGVWSYKPRGKKLAVEVEPFGKLSKVTRTGIEREASPLATFFEREVELQIV